MFPNYLLTVGVAQSNGCLYFNLDSSFSRVSLNSALKRLPILASKKIGTLKVPSSPHIHEQHFPQINSCRITKQFDRNLIHVSLASITTNPTIKPTNNSNNVSPPEKNPSNDSNPTINTIKKQITIITLTAS